MSEDFLKDPLSLFSVKGKTAVITGATGAFGALAAKVMAGAGAHVVICANNAPGLKKNDSCYIGPNESREIVNRGNDVCTIFVAVAAPPA